MFQAPPSFILLLSLLLLLLATSPSSAGKCNKDDKRALLAIKAAFNNAYHFASWTNATACCDWYDVRCNINGRVAGLSLFQDANLHGTIPTAIADLPYLDELFLDHLPNLVGPIPAALANLKRLNFLLISWTNVSGPVPAFVSRLPNLSQLILSFNNLSGQIPPELADAPSTLVAIDISRNKLTGSLPPFLFKNSNNTYLLLSHNRLSGVVPSDYGNVNYVQIDLSRNNLSGDASFLFGKSKTAAQQIDISRNSFAFNLTGVDFPERASFIDLSHNKIFGSIPQQITNVEILLLNVSYNRLCGEIPSDGQLDRSDQYNFLHNKCLCGTPLPACK